MAGPSSDHYEMVEVLQLAVANIREFVALQKVGKLLGYRASHGERLPQLDELQSIVDRVETVLSNYATGLPRRG